MSKKSKRQTALKELAAHERAETRKPPIKQDKRVKKAAGRAVKTAGAVKAFDRPNGLRPGGMRLSPSGIAPANLLYVRIVAAVIALAALGGGVAWVLSLKGTGANLPTIIGLIALGIVAGLALYLAVRTQEVLRALSQRAARR